MLWVDKHRPTSLDGVNYHHDLSSRLARLAGSGDLPHLLFHGPSGSGKKTRIMALLREIYGPGTDKLRLEHRSFKTPTKKTIELTTIASNYHIEMNPGDAGNNDRFVVQDVIKEIAQTASLTATSQGAPRAFKVVLLVEVDRLTKQAQAGLRRTMEKYTSTCRLILCCNNPSKVIAPLRSRCLGVRVAAPTHDEVCAVLQSVARKESLQLPDEVASKVAKHSKRNLRRALLLLEACRVQQYPFSPDQPVQPMDWEVYIAQLANDLMQDQSPQQLLKAREKLYDLLSHCIPADVIMDTLSRALMLRLDDDLKHEVSHWAAFYEHRIQTGSKEIFHLEAFVAKFMSLYRTFMMAMFAD